MSLEALEVYYYLQIEFNCFRSLWTLFRFAVYNCLLGFFVLFNQHRQIVDLLY